MSDIVNSPPHYKGVNGLEAIDVIQGYGLGYCLGNVIKYVLRADRKGFALTDLQKARWYIDREIAARMEGKLESAQAPVANTGSPSTESPGDFFLRSMGFR